MTWETRVRALWISLPTIPRHAEPSQNKKTQHELFLSLRMNPYRIEKSSDTWMINFNASKIKELLITRPKVPREHPSIIFKNETIKILDELRLLGIHFSADTIGTTTLIGWEPPTQESSELLFAAKIFFSPTQLSDKNGKNWTIEKFCSILGISH